MAASANPSEENQEASSSKKRSSSSMEPNVNNSSSAAEVSQTPSALRHIPVPGIATDWTAEEQSIMDDLLAKYASDAALLRYMQIAKQLPEKTVRDVALRCRWLNKKESGKRRKDDHSSMRKSKDRKGIDSSAKSSSHQNTGPSALSHYVPPMISADNDDGISYKDLGGLSGELLEQNSHILNQISANFAAFKIHENIGLLCRARDNIVTILNDLNDVPEVMKQMPPLPTKVNEELANSILPQRHCQRQR